MVGEKQVDSLDEGGVVENLYLVFSLLWIKCGGSGQKITTPPNNHGDASASLVGTESASTRFNAALLQRLGLWNPVEHLQQDTARHWIARWQLQSQKHKAENDVLHQSWDRLKQLVQYTSPAGQWHKNALLFHLRHQSNDESVMAILLALGVTEQELQAHAAYVSADTEAPADPRRIQITVDEFVHCPHCDATFPSVCGLRHHIGRKHGNEFITKASPVATTPESIRGLGQDGMPTCRRCGNCYVRWDEFTRHILEDRCHPKPGFVDVPVCLSQDKTVLKGLTDNWISYLESQPWLKDKLKSHCAICNQWFCTLGGLTQHTNRQHPQDYREACARYAHLLLDYGGRLTPPCLFCGGAFVRKHRCAVLLQIATLKARAQSPTDPLLSAKHDERRAGFAARNSDLSGNAQPRQRHPTDGHRRRRKSAPGQKAQDQPGEETQLLQRRRCVSEAIGAANGSPSDEARRHAKHIKAGYLFHDFHEQQRAGGGASATQAQRKMEGREAAYSGHSQQSSTPDPVCSSHGGIHEEDWRPQRRIRGKRSVGHAKKHGIVNSAKEFFYRKWDQDQGKLVALDLPPLPLKDALAALDDIHRNLGPGIVHRFHATRPLSEKMQGPTTPFMLEIGLRHPNATVIYNALVKLSRNSITEAMGMTMRPSTLQRSQLAQDIQTTLNRIEKR